MGHGSTLGCVVVCLGLSLFAPARADELDPPPVPGPQDGAQQAAAPSEAPEVRIGGPGIELVDGQEQVIAALSFPGKLFQVLRVGTIVYVVGDLTGGLIVDISDPRAPRALGTFATGAVVGLEVHGLNLHLRRADGSLAIFDIRTPAHPELIAAIGHSDRPVLSPLDRADPPAADRHTASAYARGIMMATLLPSIYSEFGGERNPDGGLWAAGALLIVNAGSTSFIPGIRAHATIGYSGAYFAIGADVGGAAGFGLLGFGAIDLGFALRLGRFDGSHVKVLLYWSPLPAVIQFPLGGELELQVPISNRTRFQVALRGDYFLGMLGAGTIGAQHLISSEPKGHTFITWGVGAGFQYGSLPGALIQVGYLYRH